MKCTFDVTYYCDHCGERHATYTQYSREVENPPEPWDAYADGRKHIEVKNLLGKTFSCQEFPNKLTKILEVDQLVIWRLS